MCLSIASSTSSSIGDPSKGREDAGRGRGGESSPVGKGMGERKRDDVMKRISHLLGMLLPYTSIIMSRCMYIWVVGRQ